MNLCLLGYTAVQAVKSTDVSEEYYAFEMLFYYQRTHTALYPEDITHHNRPCENLKILHSTSTVSRA
jgi:hypothetical protein